jgi:alkylhydroperoxidase/carboxymuconolactone decarboxylase family protein YurZ
MPAESDDYERGAQLRRLMLGEEWTENASVDADGPMGQLVDVAIRHVWAAYWARPGLDLRSRSIATIVLMTALGREDELGLHVAAALRNDLLSQTEITELLLHTGGYLGIPAAQRGIKVAAKVFGAGTD